MSVILTLLALAALGYAGYRVYLRVRAKMESIDIVTGDDPFVHPETRSTVKAKRKSKKQQ
jgi:hypothetical protein